MAKILIDTGVFVALFDGDDKFHQKSVEFIKNNRSPLMTTLANIAEVLYLLTDSKTQYQFLNWLHLAKIDIAPLGGRELVAIGELMVRYDSVPMDFADGCLLYLANTHKINQIATIDRDFRIYRIDGKYPFRLLIDF
ncbi:MAG: PIN domain-containing protein [Moraxella sp.]|nr:PIN domain-containing protein [Moraxella sp.]